MEKTCDIEGCQPIPNNQISSSNKIFPKCELCQSNKKLKKLRENQNNLINTRSEKNCKQYSLMQKWHVILRVQFSPSKKCYIYRTFFCKTNPPLPPLSPPPQKKKPRECSRWRQNLASLHMLITYKKKIYNKNKFLQLLGCITSDIQPYQGFNKDQS